MYKQGDILLIPIPFSDLTSIKKRPVLVLSNSTYNQKTEDIVVAAITSNLYEKKYSVLINKEDLQEGNLKIISSIRIDKIYTLSKLIVIRKFGSVRSNIIKKVKSKLFDLLDEEVL